MLPAELEKQAFGLDVCGGARRANVLVDTVHTKRVVLGLFVAILAYLLMDAPLARHLTFNFPELHLVTFGLILLMGQYTGYKLSELRRFRPVRDFS